MSDLRIFEWWIGGLAWLSISVCLAAFLMAGDFTFSRFFRYIITMAAWISGTIILLVNYFGPRFG